MITPPADTIKVKPYRAYTDTAECFKVFQIVRGFSTGVYTKDEAREKFKNVDLKDVNSFRPHIRDIIKDIVREEKTVVKTVEKVEDVDVKDVVKVEKAEDTVKPTTFRKKFNK